MTYLQRTLTLSAAVGIAIAAKLWMDKPPAVASNRPYAVWPDDGDVVGPILERRLGRIVIDARTMQQALAQFRQQSATNIVWSDASLPVMSGDPIRMELNGVTVGTALRRLLAFGAHAPPIGTRDGIIEIGDSAPVCRFYRVNHLLARVLENERGVTPPTPAELEAEQLRGSQLLGAILLHLNASQQHAFQATAGDFSYFDGVLIARLPVDVHRRLAQFLQAISSARR